MTIFIRLLDAPVDKKQDLLRQSIEAYRENAEVGGNQVFERSAERFVEVPGSPFGYWVSDVVRLLFKSLPAFASQRRVAASGGKTLDDFRWIRAAWEVLRRPGEWVGFAKGGAFSPFYSDIHLLLDWRSDARALKEYLITYRSSRGWSPNWTAELHGSEHYLRPGLTWPRRTQGGFGIRAMPAGCFLRTKGRQRLLMAIRQRDCLPCLRLRQATPLVTSSAFRWLLARTRWELFNVRQCRIFRTKRQRGLPGLLDAPGR